MSERIEQRYCIKFCYKLGDTQVQTIQKIQQAFGDEAMGITQIKEWYNRFKQEQISVESKPRSGRPSTSRNKEFVENVRRIVEDDRRITIKEITEEVGISTGSVHTILTEDLAMQRVSAKFVPKLLVEQQKQLRLEIAQDLLDCANSDSDFMKTSSSLVMRHGCTLQTWHLVTSGCSLN
ncbi:protein GVQW3-like [Macrobrachium nipponense]|uniref:protein GVQW3-like n=1 Tax=Macrobrachium nipponense TaxID=159736 RepID=UPI0030C858CB